jgi:hypothetical protein
LDFQLAEEHQMLKDLVAKFVRDQLIPWSPPYWRATPPGSRSP